MDRVVFFPRWIELNPAATVCFQNDHLDRMAALRDAGPTYPVQVVDEFAEITFAEHLREGDESVITCSPADLPPGYAARRN